MQIIHQSYRVGEIFDSGKHSELPSINDIWQHLSINLGL